MPKKLPFFFRETGSQGEKDNNYALVIADDGTAWIDYKWSWVSPHKGEHESGTEIISLAEYLKNGEGLEKLRAIMAEHGVKEPD